VCNGVTDERNIRNTASRRNRFQLIEVLTINVKTDRFHVIGAGHDYNPASCARA